MEDGPVHSAGQPIRYLLPAMTDAPDHACLRCIISGTVQGVFFRVSTRAEARRLGIAGHAKNLANGSVEVIACGKVAALNELRDWLHTGPDLARVRTVRCEPVALKHFSDFQIL